MLPSSAYSLISRLTHYERDLKRDLGPTASRSAIRHPRPELTKLYSAGLKTVEKGDQKLPLKKAPKPKSRGEERVPGLIKCLIRATIKGLRGKRALTKVNQFQVISCNRVGKRDFHTLGAYRPIYDTAMTKVFSQ